MISDDSDVIFKINKLKNFLYNKLNNDIQTLKNIEAAYSGIVDICRFLHLCTHHISQTFNTVYANNSAIFAMLII